MHGCDHVEAICGLFVVCFACFKIKSSSNDVFSHALEAAVHSFVSTI